MKFIKLLPFSTAYDGFEHEVGLWASETNVCEYSDAHMPDPTDTAGACDSSGHYYGTSSELDPLYCARHFYHEVVSGDRKGAVWLVDGQAPSE